MIPFEIHITGQENIIPILTENNIKNIIVELLNPKGETHRTEYMSSFIHKSMYSNIHYYVLSIIDDLCLEPIRVKIECPPISNLFHMSLYMESHSKGKSNVLPTSRNKLSGKYMTTKREYNKNNYNKFIEENKDTEVELCIFDSFKEEDLDWFDLYKGN